MDSDGYPDDDEISTIQNWSHSDFSGLMEYIRKLWFYADFGYWRQCGERYLISTAGWSGNETLIDAMRSNTIFWGLCWVSSRRGGHYEFIVKGES